MEVDPTKNSLIEVLRQFNEAHKKGEKGFLKVTGDKTLTFVPAASGNLKKDVINWIDRIFDAQHYKLHNVIATLNKSKSSLGDQDIEVFNTTADTLQTKADKKITNFLKSRSSKEIGDQKSKTK